MCDTHTTKKDRERYDTIVNYQLSNFYEKFELVQNF